MEKDAEESCGIAWEPEDGVSAAAKAEGLGSHMTDCLDLHTRITEMLSRRRAGKQVLTSTQIAAVTKVRDSLQHYLGESARVYIGESICLGLTLCVSALEHDGYTVSNEITGSCKAAAESNTDDVEPTGSGKAAAESNTAVGETTAAESFSEALTRERLEEALKPVQVYGHKLWKILGPQFSEWTAQAPCAIDIMCALLSKTEAWTVFDRVAPNREQEVFALVDPALLTLGVDLSFIKTNWQEKLLDKYIRLSEEETGKISEPLQHMIGEAMKGSFAMTEEQVNKILSYAPGKKELKRHLHKVL